MEDTTNRGEPQHQNLLKQKNIFEKFYYQKKKEVNRPNRHSSISSDNVQKCSLKVLTLSKCTLLTSSNSNVQRNDQLDKNKQYALFNIADTSAQAFLIAQTKQSLKLLRVFKVAYWRTVVIKYLNDFIVAIYVQRPKDYVQLQNEQIFKQQVLKGREKHDITNISWAKQLSAKLNQFQSPQQFQRKKQLLFKTKPKSPRQYNFKKDKRKMSKISSEEEFNHSDDHQQTKNKDGRDRSKSVDLKHKFNQNQKSSRKIEKGTKSHQKQSSSNKQNMNQSRSMHKIAEKIQKQNRQMLDKMPKKYRKIRLNYLIRQQLYQQQYKQRFKQKIEYQRQYQRPEQFDWLQDSQGSYSQSSSQSQQNNLESQEFDERQYR